MRRHELAGKRFGMVSVLRVASSDKWGVKWFCQCDCGKQFTRYRSNLVKSLNASCGCSRLSSRHNLQGKKFGKLTVGIICKKNAYNRHIYWFCKCDCGTELYVYGPKLGRDTFSCNKPGCNSRFDFLCAKCKTGPRLGRYKCATCRRNYSRLEAETSRKKNRYDRETIANSYVWRKRYGKLIGNQLYVLHKLNKTISARIKEKIQNG